MSWESKNGSLGSNVSSNKSIPPVVAPVISDVPVPPTITDEYSPQLDIANPEDPPLQAPDEGENQWMSNGNSSPVGSSTNSDNSKPIINVQNHSGPPSNPHYRYQDNQSHPPPSNNHVYAPTSTRQNNYGHNELHNGNHSQSKYSHQNNNYHHQNQRHDYPSRSVDQPNQGSYQNKPIQQSGNMNKNIPYRPTVEPNKISDEENVINNKKPDEVVDPEDDDLSEMLLKKLCVENNYNPEEFNLDLENARFFIIKSFSEDDIHRSIKYSIWCSTPYGNKRLDTAFRQQEENGPIYLFFSVNRSGHFCGVAQMMSHVDYNASSGVWSQDKWKGQFKVQWIYVKDVPNDELRHITLENNENRPVTHSRDTQEVPYKEGKQVIDIIHCFKHQTSIFDDFLHYEKKQVEESNNKSDNCSPPPPPPPPPPEHQRFQSNVPGPNNYYNKMQSPPVNYHLPQHHGSMLPDQSMTQRHNRNDPGPGYRGNNMNQNYQKNRVYNDGPRNDYRNNDYPIHQRNNMNYHRYNNYGGENRNYRNDYRNEPYMNRDPYYRNNAANNSGNYRAGGGEYYSQSSYDYHQTQPNNEYRSGVGDYPREHPRPHPDRGAQSWRN
ncbi:hypothetical protein QR98_0052230 [Sarcoptes scabiei]|uniref:Uncharacterized protein n=1 Tax=Sarcoptes scabiei TaxID=52283 RepID=A0A132A7Y6_SARSC|nr:hypothetical protein QR98_0052230 [Sarcoptes scabiei]